MRECRVLAKTAKDPALHTEGAKRAGTTTGKLILGHILTRAINRCFVGDNGNVVRTLHQRDLRR